MGVWLAFILGIAGGALGAVIGIGLCIAIAEQHRKD